MFKFKSLVHKLLPCLLPVTLVSGISAVAIPTVSADVYMYVDDDGRRWLTNTAVKNRNAKLVARYGAPRVPHPSRPQPRAQHHAKPASNNYNEMAYANAQPSSCGVTHATLEQRAAPYAKTIRAYSRAYGVEESLVRAVIRQESCFKRKAKSHAGARGLMQLMPGTARLMGVKNSYNATQNIKGGVKYLSQQLKKFGGNKHLALAAYNAGPGNVKKHGGIPPFRETRNYVKKVMAEYHRLQRQQGTVNFQRASYRR